MLVRDLIELLQEMDADMEVHFAYNYGDHWRTEVAPAISNVHEGVVAYSEYHRMDKMVTVEEDYDELDEDSGERETKTRKVVVLV